MSRVQALQPGMGYAGFRPEAGAAAGILVNTYLSCHRYARAQLILSLFYPRKLYFSQEIQARKPWWAGVLQVALDGVFPHTSAYYE